MNVKHYPTKKILEIHVCQHQARAMVGVSVAPCDVIVAEFLPEISCWERWFEVIATVTTGVVFLTKVVRPPGVFLIACTTLWTSWFIFQRCRHGSKIFFVWGLRIDQPNLKYSFILPSIFALLAIVGIAIAAVVQEHRMQFENWHLWLVLVLYPFWGLLQQAPHLQKQWDFSHPWAILDICVQMFGGGYESTPVQWLVI